MTQVILGKSRVREICMPGSVRAKAKWLSYSTIPATQHPDLVMKSPLLRLSIKPIILSLLSNIS